MAVDQQYITHPSLAPPVLPEPIWRLSVEQYTEPTGEAEEPDYQRRQDYFPEDEIPVVIEGREVGP